VAVCEEGESGRLCFEFGCVGRCAGCCPASVGSAQGVQAVCGKGFGWCDFEAERFNCGEEHAAGADEGVEVLGRQLCEGLSDLVDFEVSGLCFLGHRFSQSGGGAVEFARDLADTELVERPEHGRSIEPAEEGLERAREARDEFGSAACPSEVTSAFGPFLVGSEPLPHDLFGRCGGDPLRAGGVTRAVWIEVFDRIEREALDRSCAGAGGDFVPMQLEQQRELLEVSVPLEQAQDGSYLADRP
jgi:hypothetical protein